jgi:hypothetical protein
MTRRRPTLLVQAALLASSVVVVAACGGDGDDGATAVSGSGTAASSSAGSGGSTTGAGGAGGSGAGGAATTASSSGSGGEGGGAGGTGGEGGGAGGTGGGPSNVEVLYEANNVHMTSVAIDATTAYAGSDQGLWAIPKSGGGATLLDPATGVVGVAVSDSHVYFTRGPQGNGEVRRIPKGGGVAEIVHTSNEPAGSVAVRGDYVYFTEKGPNQQGGCLFEAPLDGSAAPAVIDCQLCDPGSVAVDDGNVYVANFNCFEGELVRFPIGGGVKETIANDSPVGVAVGGGQVFWGHHTGPVGWRATAGGPIATTPIAYNYAQGMVADETGLYLGHEGVTGFDGRIVQLLPDGQVTELASGFLLPEMGFVNMGVDATHVYFAGSVSFTGTAVMRTSKP